VQKKRGGHNQFGSSFFVPMPVSEYQALPDLDAKATAVAIELENDGWERDRTTVGVQ
jgi:hypothetical protein